MAQAALQKEYATYGSIVEQIHQEYLTYIDVLTHDDRNSNYILSKIKNGEMVTCASNAHNLRALNPWNMELCDTYVTINGFNGKRRLTERTRQINGFVFDIDIHNNENGVSEGVKCAYIALKNAVSDTRLPHPTMIVSTGRGLHVYYMLERSMPYRVKSEQGVVVNENF